MGRGMTVAALDALALRDEAQQQCLDAIAFTLQGDPAEFDRDAHAVTLTPGSSPPHSLHVAGRSPSRRIPDGQELQPPVEPISFGRSGIVGELGVTRPTIDRSVSQLPAVPSTLLAPTGGGVKL